MQLGKKMRAEIEEKARKEYFELFREKMSQFKLSDLTHKSLDHICVRASDERSELVKQLDGLREHSARERLPQWLYPYAIEARTPDQQTRSNLGGDLRNCSTT